MPGTSSRCSADHGTHEQFHCEFKTDLDLTRLPSGKFDTNHLMCQLAALAMHILRLMGSAACSGRMRPCGRAPRGGASRHRLKPDTSRNPKIALSARCGVSDTQGAKACERIGAFASTEKRLHKPPADEIDVRMDILTIKLRLEIGRTGRWSRIQVAHRACHATSQAGRGSRRCCY